MSQIRHLITTGQGTIGIILQTLVFIICVWYAVHDYRYHIHPEKRVKEEFIQTTCIVEAKNIRTTGNLLHRYRAEFQLSYTVDQLPYRSIAFANGLNGTFTPNLSDVDDDLAQYEINTPYDCYYDPITPQTTALTINYFWYSTLPLVVPVLIAIVMGFSLAKKALQGVILIGIFTVKARQKRRTKKGTRK